MSDVQDKFHNINSVSFTTHLLAYVFSNSDSHACFNGPISIIFYKGSLFLLKEHLVGKCSDELPGIVYCPQGLSSKMSSSLYGCNPSLFWGCTGKKNRPSGASILVF